MGIWDGNCGNTASPVPSSVQFPLGGSIVGTVGAIDAGRTGVDFNTCVVLVAGVVFFLFKVTDFVTTNGVAVAVGFDTIVLGSTVEGFTEDDDFVVSGLGVVATDDGFVVVPGAIILTVDFVVTPDPVVLTIDIVVSGLGVVVIVEH